MTNQKTIFVTGGTGNQGGALARTLLRHGFKVKVLTRNTESIKAGDLRRLGVEIIRGDLDEMDSFKNHLKGVDGIFSNPTYENGVDREVKQGKGIADLAKRYGVPHLIYSSVGGAHLKTGIPHFESKFEIEDHIRSLSIPYTIIRPVSLYENFLLPQVKSRILKGKLVSPVNRNAIQQFITAEDVGRISGEMFMNREKYLGRTITVGTEQLDNQQVADIFSEALGKEIKYQKLPGLITRLVMGKDLHIMFRWINEHNAIFMEDISATKKEFPGMISLKEWIGKRFKNE